MAMTGRALESLDAVLESNLEELQWNQVGPRAAPFEPGKVPAELGEASVEPEAASVEPGATPVDKGSSASEAPGSFSDSGWKPGLCTLL